MSDRPYDITSPASIKRYANQLENATLAQVVNELPPNAYKPSNKGRLGSMVEEYFFGHKPGPNRDHDPDFSEAGVELKVTGVIPRKPANGFEAPYKAKERLVLTMIDYIALDKEMWRSSSLLKKCRLLLVMFYLYEKEKAASDTRFVLPPLLWEFPREDLEIIEKDWLAIQQKVRDKKAHELSEGDTFYLAACRKGSGGPSERLREQPYSGIKAKARAFSLKPSYVNVMIEAAHHDAAEKTLIRTKADAERGIEEVAIEKFQPLAGSSVAELIERYGLASHNPKSKSLFHILAMRILGTKKKYLPEFEKAGIVVKTIRLQASGIPKESMSFPTFDFGEVASQEWEESALCHMLEQKFFFVVYQYDSSGVLRFKKALFWNMPYDDRLAAREAWMRARAAIKASRPSGFPKASDSPVVHVRPHGRNAQDTLPLPDGTLHTKQCFWLNAKYIGTIVR